MNLSKRELELLLEVIKKERLSEPISTEQGKSLFVIENRVINKIIENDKAIQNALPRVKDIKKLNEEFIAIQEAANQISEAFKAGVSVDSLEVKTDTLIGLTDKIKELERSAFEYETVICEKELCDTVRELALKSPCTVLDGAELLKDSNNLSRDRAIIHELKCRGIYNNQIKFIIKTINKEFKEDE